MGFKNRLNPLIKVLVVVCHDTCVKRIFYSTCVLCLAKGSCKVKDFRLLLWRLKMYPSGKTIGGCILDVGDSQNNLMGIDIFAKDDYIAEIAVLIDGPHKRFMKFFPGM